MSEENVKPSIVPSIYEIEKKLKSVGLTQRNMITLIMDETRPKMKRKDVINCINAAKKIEKQIKDCKLPFY